MRSLFVLIFALSLIACGDGDRQPDNQSANPLYPSGPEQVQRGQIVIGEGSVVSEAEVVIIDAERLVVLARAPVDDQGGFVVSVPQRPSYWLGVSGPYMTTYIDTAFAFTGEAITIGEPPRSHAAGKAAQVVGILGDVNNDNQVDIADALLVLLYTLERVSFVAPNQGNISLGDVNEDGQIDIADVLLIMTYIANPLDPTLPDGIGLATEQTAVAVAVEQDRAVLIALYEATGGNNWYDNANWLSSTYPLAQWYGVETDDEGQVTTLNLAYNDLTETIPEALGQLNSLQYLDLSENELTGLIPEALGQLDNLDTLDLGENELTGPIPETLGQLNNLLWLDLGENELMGPIPETLGNLGSLQYLWLGDNQLTGAIPETLGQLNNLEGLFLSENELTGPIPETLGQLNNLLWLVLSDNQLTGTIPEALGQLDKLENLFLNDNQLMGPIPETLGNLDSLISLFLAENGLTGAIPETLGQLDNLWGLNLSGNQLTGTIPETLGQLDKLQYLDLSGNDWTGCIPLALQAIPDNDLDDLGLAFCLLDDRAPLVAFYEATGGDHWTDNTNWLSEVPLNEWYGVTTDDKGRVTALDLSQNELTGPIPSALAQLYNLQTLYLGGNDWTGCIPSVLQDVPNNDLDDLGLAFCLPELAVDLYGTLVSTFTNIFFAALVPGTTSVPGEGGGSVEIAGNDWTLQDYSPDGALIINGTLNIDLMQDPIPMSGEVTLSGSHEAELILNMEFSVGADGLSATGTITINGAEFDVAELSAAAAAEASG